jgi:hypothetical protein
MNQRQYVAKIRRCMADLHTRGAAAPEQGRADQPATPGDCMHEA